MTDVKFEHKTREEWTSISEATDAAVRGQINKLLQSLGHQPTAYVKWSAAQKVDEIMKAQGDAKKAPPAAAGKKPNPAAAAGKASTPGNGKAAHAPAAKGPATVDLGPVMAELEAVKEELAEINGFVKDAHLLLKLLLSTDTNLQANAEDEDIRKAFYGTLIHPSQESAEAE